MESIYSHLPVLLGKLEQPVIFELGAHYGFDTLELRRLFPGAKIYAFEPDPRNLYRLKQLVGKSVTIVPAAVGDNDCKATFHLSSGEPPKGDPHYIPSSPKEPWSYSSSLKEPVKHLTDVPWVKFDRTATVDVMRLDTFCQKNGVGDIDFIWADIQGAEDLMIAGGQATLARTSYLYTEYADDEVYKGQISLAEIVKRLPGKWEVLVDFEMDALLRNVSKLGPANPYAQ
jgi:2-O-methyltransferase